MFVYVVETVYRAMVIFNAKYHICLIILTTRDTHQHKCKFFICVLYLL